MDYEKFSDAITWTQKYWEDRRRAKKGITKPECQKYPDCSYSALRKRSDDYWLHLERMSASELADEIITCFLNTRRWCCHIPKPGTPEGRAVVGNLESAVDQLSDYYGALDGFRIEDINFRGSCTFKGQEAPILGVIDGIYSIFRTIKPQFGRVPASKLMHMALPNLFVMWDREIIKSYGVPSDKYDSHSYAAFLVLMQENICHVIESHPYASTLAGQQVIQQIQAEHNGLPIPRLLDMANNAVAYAKERAQDFMCRDCVDGVNCKFAEELKWYTGTVGLKKYKC